MQVEARKIIYWKPSSEKDAFPFNNMNNTWDIDVVHSQQDAMEMLDKYEYKVGLAHLARDKEDQERQFENLLTNNYATEWVALVDRNTGSVDKSLRESILNSIYDYHTLPADTDKLLTTLGHAYGMARLKEKTNDLPCEIHSDESEMVGTSEAMRHLFRRIRKVATVDAPILITGESGTGKELAALAIHERSSRKQGPFVAVNCGALPDNLVQSELFGYEKGAFTGASEQKKGRIESAEGGTIFLDEIGDLPLQQQINLLRFLQEKTIDRIGGTKSIHVDTRVIAATHIDLEKAVEEGRFREDLYYRLNVLSIVVPPLREREGDIEILARYMFNKFITEKNHNVNGFSQEALQRMAEYHWPGNVREMINKIRRAMLMCEGKLITSKDLDLERRRGLRQVLTLDEVRKRAETEAILSGLRHTRNNISQASKLLGISRITLYRLMEKYSISPEQV